MNKKYLFLALKILIILAVIGGVGWEFHKSWDKIQHVQWEPHYIFLVLSGICYALAFIPAAVFWRYAMQTLGQQPGVAETFRAYYIGHLGKYVPGKVMVLIIRSGLLNREKTNITAAAASVFVETMTMMAVGAFVAAVTVLCFFSQINHGSWLTFVILGIMIGTVLPILPPVFHFIAKKCKIELEGLRFQTLAVGWILNIPVWIILGVSLWFTMLGFGMKSESLLMELPVCTLAISFSMVLGFASMIPGGFAVREAAMVAVLVPFFTSHPIGGIDPMILATVLVVVLRIISILSELAVSAVLAVTLCFKTNR